MSRPRTASFDVFDTVVTRTFAHPRDLFVHLGAVLAGAGIPVPPPRTFAERRWAAEHAARHACPWTEVLLADIYAELGRQLDWSPALSDRAMQLELETESRHLRGIPIMRPVLEAAREQAGRLVFLSDMYLPSSTLLPWLVREGVAATGDALLVSGEERGHKSSGALFRAAQRKLGGELSAWDHVGDHPLADVESPRRLGITARHVTAARLHRREQAIRGTRGEFAPVWRSLLAGAARLTRLERTLPDARRQLLWETGATVAGPLFYGFVRWTLDEARSRGLRRLHFLARDGQIYWRIARLLEDGRADATDCRYLYASRLAFTGPAELEDPATLRRLCAPTGHFHSLRQALEQLNLRPEELSGGLPAGFDRIHPDENLTLPQREALAAWLQSPGQSALLRAALEQRWSAARSYLADAGVDGNSGLVDTGWLGSIQRNIERLLGRDGRPQPLTGYYLGLMPPQGPRPAGRQIGYANVFAPLPLLREESHKVLLELLSQGDHGQVLGFRRTERGSEPVLHATGPVNLEEIRLFQDAVLAFARRMREVEELAAAPREEFARVVWQSYREFHDTPTRAEAELFGFLPHADQLLEQRHATLCARLDLGEVWTALRDHRRRPPYWWIGGQAALGHGPLLRSFRTLKRLRWRLAGRAE